MNEIKFLAIGLVVALCHSVNAETTIGVGPRFFKTTDSLPGQFAESGMGGSLDVTTGLSDWLSGQIGFTVFGDGYAGSQEEVLSPQALLLVGQDLYVGAGLGILYSDSDLADSPFPIFRAGGKFGLTERVDLDMSLSYELGNWEGVNDFDQDEESDVLVAAFTFRFGL